MTNSYDRREFNRDIDIPVASIAHDEFADQASLRQYAMLMRNIEKGGLTGKLVLFGGALRDAFYGMRPSDIDLSPMVTNPDDMDENDYRISALRRQMTKARIQKGYTRNENEHGQSRFAKHGYNIKGIFQNISIPMQFDWGLPRQAYSSVDSMRMHRIAGASAPILSATMDSDGNIMADARFLEHAKEGLWEPHPGLNSAQMLDMRHRFSKFSNRAYVQGVEKAFEFVEPQLRQTETFLEYVRRLMPTQN